MKYAFGEIILVVVGILIALQINNWNSERLEKIEEIRLLVKLQHEFETNQENIDFILSEQENVIRNTWKDDRINRTNWNGVQD